MPPPRHPLFSGGGLEGAEVFFLGTGCAAPTKNRGCSGIYLRIPQGGLVREGTGVGEPLRLLMDAGEGTLGHLERQFGRDGALREVRALDCVWISHKHADHHSGLFRLVVEHHRAAASSQGAAPARAEARRAPLLVIAPSQVLGFLDACKRASGEAVEFRAKNCKTLVRGARWNGGDVQRGQPGDGQRGRLGAAALVAGMNCVPVVHCSEAYGLVLQPLRDGAKLVYSGDTRPCERLVRAGAGAAILIHEATFDDSERERAVAKHHSTTSEALEVGRRMRAQEVVLTHFSQRYPRVPVLHPGQSRRYSVAFDGMVLNRDTAGVVSAAAGLLSVVLEPKADADDPEDTEMIPLD